MKLSDFVSNLLKDKQFELAIQLVGLTMPIWEKFADKNKLSYHDSVVGLKHSVDRNLLRDTIYTSGEYLAASRLNIQFSKTEKLEMLYKQFEDPIIALQDDDWNLPYEVVRTFYAVYNLLASCSGQEQTVFEESTIYISINQSIDALESSGLMTAEDINKEIEKIKKSH